NDHFRANLHSVVQVDDVQVCEADAATRHLLADCGRRVRAMDAILRTADVHGARTERIAGAAGSHPWHIRLPTPHLPRRIPIPPLGLALDRFHARPGEAFPADADA